MQLREARVAPASWNDAERTIDVVWTTGAQVRRYDWWSGSAYDEELVVTPEAVDLTRLNSGAAPVLDTHGAWSLSDQIGVVVSARIDAGEGIATLRLSERPEVASLVADIRAGIVRNISVGYSVRKYEIVTAAARTDGAERPLYRAVDWEPAEISFVPVPADAGAGTRAAPQSPQGGAPCEFFTRAAPAHPQEIPMPGQASQAGAVQPSAPDQSQQGQQAQQRAAAAPAAAAVVPAETPPAATDAVAAERQRCADIQALAAQHRMPERAAEWITAGRTVDHVRGLILEARAAADESAGGHRNVRVETVNDEADTRRRGLEEALMHRLDPRAQLTDNGRQYRGRSLLEIGDILIEAGGGNTRGMARMERATAMLQVRSHAHMGTGDFASLLSNLAGKRLRAAYEQAAPTYTVWARRAPNAPDFKSITAIALSGAPELLQTNEHGEFKYGSLGEAAESYKVVTYGRIVALTRQAIINDDLRAFDRLITAFGDASARLENRLVYAQLAASLADGKAVFHADHANLGTAALGLAGLGAGRLAMRKQTGLAGELLNVIPAYLLVPAALETTAYQYTSSAYTPVVAEQVNEFRAGGRTALTPVVEPLLDAASATAWYLAASNGQIDTVEFAYLDGAEGPVIESETGFEVDGISLKARLDFAAKAIDYRGLYKSAGTA